jgi:hypothetical protein
VRDGTEKHGHSLVEGASRAVALMNQREIAQAQSVSSENAIPSGRKTLQRRCKSAHAAPVSCNMRARHTEQITVISSPGIAPLRKAFPNATRRAGFGSRPGVVVARFRKTTASRPDCNAGPQS